MGKISINRVLKEEAPKAWEAKVYSFSFSTSTEDLTILVKAGIETKLTAKIAFCTPGPNTATTTMARRILGKDIKMSIERIMTRSRFPPKYPAMRPRNVPKVSDIITTQKPIIIDILEPNIIRLKISRPRSSVPKIKSKLPLSVQKGGVLKWFS